MFSTVRYRSQMCAVYWHPKGTLVEAELAVAGGLVSGNVLQTVLVLFAN